MIDKTIFISHSSKDQAVSLEIATALEERLDKEKVWIDFFDLTAGDELVPVISKAIGKAKWFILIASNSSMESAWVKHEAKLALFHSIEKKDFRIITLKIDDVVFPEDIDLELRSRKYVDGKKNISGAIDEIVTTIQKQSSTRSHLSKVFVDRGEKLDNFEQVYGNFQVIFAVGWHGIGKTSIIEEFANIRLGVPYIKIDITPGHDNKLLTRQIISKVNGRQPSDEADINELIKVAFNSLEKYFRDYQGFLFFDDAENAMDNAGQFRPYFQNFINRYTLSKNLYNPLIISTIQQPDIPLQYSSKIRIIPIEPLPDPFILQCIQRWFFTIKKQNIEPSLDLDSIIGVIGGHPLSAYLLASYLAFQSADIINSKKFISTFRKNSAEFILRSFIEHLNDFDILLMSIIAVVSSGINVKELSSLRIVRKESPSIDVVEEVKNSLSKLAQRLLIIQEGEKIVLHSFLGAFFSRIAQEKGVYRTIAEESGNLIYKKTLAIIKKIKYFEEDSERAKNNVYRHLNHQLLGYLAPAHRLLLISGQKEKAAKLPFNLQGHFREMVFIYYQIYRNYESVLEFSKQWLIIEPDDLEVLIYMARAFRKLGQFKEAEEVLNRLDKYPKNRIRAIVSREFGYIARDQGELELAIFHFQTGAKFRNNSGNPLYPLVLADLGLVLIDRAKRRGLRDTERVVDFQNAANYLQEAQRYISGFDKYYLPATIDAVMNTGREKEALAMLKDALQLEPMEPRLNLRYADILRAKPEKYDEAYEAAEIAVGGGLMAGKTIMAMIKLDKKDFKGALDCIRGFSPTNKREISVANTIEAKAFTGLSEFRHARRILDGLDYNDDPYVGLALIGNAYEECRHLFYKSELTQARKVYSEFCNWLSECKTFFPDHPQFDKWNSKEKELRDLLN